MIPSLSCLCIHKLSSFPDQIPNLPLNYASETLIKTLIPSYPDLSPLDPRLWATLVQIYGTSLPVIFTTFPIPLEHVHLPLLQQISSTPAFSLLTILELPGCSQLTDDLILTLRSLHSLAALDASDTKLSSWGLKKLFMPVLITDDADGSSTSTCGLLRILRLRNCKNVDQFKPFQNLSLLSVLGMFFFHHHDTTQQWSS